MAMGSENLYFLDKRVEDQRKYLEFCIEKDKSTIFNTLLIHHQEHIKNIYQDNPIDLYRLLKATLPLDKQRTQHYLEQFEKMGWDIGTPSVHNTNLLFDFILYGHKAYKEKHYSTIDFNEKVKFLLSKKIDFKVKSSFNIDMKSMLFDKKHADYREHLWICFADEKMKLDYDILNGLWQKYMNSIVGVKKGKEQEFHFMYKYSPEPHQEAFIKLFKQASTKTKNKIFEDHKVFLSKLLERPEFVLAKKTYHQMEEDILGSLLHQKMKTNLRDTKTKNTIIHKKML